MVAAIIATNRSTRFDAQLRIPHLVDAPHRLGTLGHDSIVSQASLSFRV